MKKSILLPGTLAVLGIVYVLSGQSSGGQKPAAPSAGAARRATALTFITWAENELDKNAAPFMPPPGLHRLNRTEYANVIRDLLDLDIDPANYLPTDDSTHGFDNIAGALNLSPTLVEAYVTA